MGINWRLLPIKVHYFLRFMGTGPLTVFLPVITRQMGVPAHVVGVIWAVVPLISLLTKTTAGAIADLTQGHRAVFLMGLVFMVTPLTALYWVPDIPTTSSSPKHNTLHASNTSTLPPFSLLTSVNSLSTPQFEEEADSGLFRGAETTTDAALTPTTVPLPKDGDGAGLLESYEFWLLFLCLLLQYCGHTTVITMQETVCFQLLGEERHKYGQQRVWGTVGIGLSAIISGAVVDLYSKVTTGAMGVMAGVLWTFEFLLVEDVAGESFEHLRLLLGLLMGVQCFLAEVPFFVLAGRIIQRLGHANALFVSLLGFTLRLVLYYFVTNPWLFLPIDLLHGISFGVAYPCFTAYASRVAPKGAAATTQGIFSATFFGSTGVGGLVGGQLFKVVGGQKTFLWMGVAAGVYSLLFFVVHAVLVRLMSSTGTFGGRDAEAERQSTKGKVKDIKEKDEEDEDTKLDLLEGEQKERKGMVMGMTYRRTEEGR